MKGLLVGIQDSGKTLLLKRLQHISVSKFKAEKMDFDTTSTVGVEIETFTNKGREVCIREVGGMMLPLWKSYYATSDYILYVVDGSNTATIGGAVMELLSLMHDVGEKGTRILVVVNKVDCYGQTGLEDFKTLVNMKELKKYKGEIHVIGVSAKSGYNVCNVMNWIFKCT